MNTKIITIFCSMYYDHKESRIVGINTIEFLEPSALFPYNIATAIMIMCAHGV